MNDDILYAAMDALEAAVDMRAAQVRYFKTRNRVDLILSKEAERHFDALASILAAKDTEA